VSRWYLLVDEVDGTAGVNVHKVHVDVVVDELSAPGHGVWEAALYLGDDTEQTHKLTHSFGPRSH
jgi:hypothetical protein